MKQVKTVGDLRAAMEGCADDLPLGIVVYGHSYLVPMHGGSHGPLFAEPALAGTGGGDVPLFVIHTDKEFERNTGYPLRREKA